MGGRSWYIISEDTSFEVVPVQKSIQEEYNLVSITTEGKCDSLKALVLKKSQIFQLVSMSWFMNEHMSTNFGPWIPNFGHVYS